MRNQQDDYLLTYLRGSVKKKHPKTKTKHQENTKLNSNYKFLLKKHAIKKEIKLWGQ